jgi:hypothetical protein
MTLLPILFSKFVSSATESLISYLTIPIANENMKIIIKNIFCLFSGSKTINFLNKNKIIERKIRKNEKVIPILKNEHKKIADTKPAIDKANIKSFFT